jgi:hypothetical protein
MARVITARRADECRAGTCEAGTRTISAGERINYGGPGAVSHAACEPISDPRRRYQGASRRYGYRGKCEDAPCCGCCD